MSNIRDESRMLRKQYHLSAVHVRRIEALRAELGVSSDAEVIRRAIDSFDVDALNTEDRALVESTADDLRDRIAVLNARIEETLERVGSNPIVSNATIPNGSRASEREPVVKLRPIRRWRPGWRSLSGLNGERMANPALRRS